MRLLRHALLVLALAAPAVVAQTPAAAPQGLQPADVFRLVYAGDPQISPDGEWVAYVRRWSDAATDRRHSNIWLVKSDGSGHRPLTAGAFTETAPRWSPDGTRLLYLSDRGGSPQVHVRYMDTGDAFALTNSATAPDAPTWSPDGGQVAYLALVSRPAPVIGTPLTPPPGATWAPPPKVTDRLTYRFNGPGELPTGNIHAFVIAATGGAARQVTSGDFDHGGTTYAPGSLAWAADGGALILPARRNPNPDLADREADLYAVDVRTGALQRLTERFGPDGDPAVSPDGRLIAYTGFDDKGESYRNTRLYVMNRDGSGKRQVAAALDQSFATPVWSADGRALYVQSDEQGNTRVLRLTLDGVKTVVASHLGEGTSAYAGGSFSVSRTGRIAFSMSTPARPSDVAVVEAGAPAAPHVLTSLNAGLLAERTLGAVEELWYTSSKDGRKVQGWIITPPRFDPAKKYPLILEIHGGPFMNYGDRFDEEKQMLAAAGYVVLYTNPRGSTSYGEAFASLIHHAYPGDDLFDLQSGVDAVIAKGYVDERNLFITGGSGGGVLTAWVTGHTTRFRAAVAFYPVTNWESMAFTADIGPRIVNNWMPGYSWDHRDNYRQRSLLEVMPKIKTPTLLMTGEEDFRTPMSETEQYYKALKMLGTEAVLVRVPGEPHGIRRRPSHEAAKLTTALGWFARHRLVVQ